MEVRHEIKLNYRHERKQSYRDFAELVNDLDTDTLFKLTKKERHGKHLNIVINEIHKREPLSTFGLKRILNQCK
mgnify:CR=1 FL=1